MQLPRPVPHPKATGARYQGNTHRAARMGHTCSLKLPRAQPTESNAKRCDLIPGQQTKNFSSAAPAASPTSKSNRGPLPGQHPQSSTHGAHVQPEAPKGSANRAAVCVALLVRISGKRQSSRSCQLPSAAQLPSPYRYRYVLGCHILDEHHHQRPRKRPVQLLVSPTTTYLPCGMTSQLAPAEAPTLQ